jgi:2-succinyl-6-hydroxy-2,4-cyclohexadiene-1-carboxylate synthase
MPHARELVLLHGFTGSAASWDAALLDDLRRRAGLEVRAVDLPGHEVGERRSADAGREDGPDDAGTRGVGQPHATVTLEDAFRSVDQAARGPTSLCGYSMGGRIALQYAAAYPGRVERLVLESATPGLVTEEERAARRDADEALARSLERHGIRRFLDDWEALPLFATQARLDARILERQRQGRLAHDPRALAAALRGLGTGVLPPLWDGLERLRIPTLLIVGEHDVRYRDLAERMARKLPSARVQVVPGAGHNVHLEQPGSWLGAVADFLRITRA